MSYLIPVQEAQPESLLIKKTQEVRGPGRHFFLIVFTLFFILGNLCLQQSSSLVTCNVLVVWFCGFIALSLAYKTLIYKLPVQVNYSCGLLIFVVFLGFFCGYTRAWTQASAYLKHSLSADSIAVDMQVVACISSFPKYDDGIVRFVINPIKHSNSQFAHLKRIRISSRLTVTKEEQVKNKFHAGDCWNWNLRAKTTRGLRNQNIFDYEKWLYQQDISATAYLRAEPEKIVKTKYPLLQLRAHIANKIINALPEKSQITALILGLSLGMRDDLGSTQWQVLQNTGTSHLLAISGLHIGIAALFGFYLAKFLFLLMSFPGVHKVSIKINSLHFSVLLGMAFALIYSALAGFSVSTQRACIMLFIAGSALISKRGFRASTIICIALLLVLLLDPIAILSGGMSLSFLAVSVLIYLSQRDKRPTQVRSLFKLDKDSKTIKAAYLQILLVIALSLPAAILFSNISLLAPLINFILIPVFSLSVVPFLLVAVILLDYFPNIAISILKFEHQWLEIIWSSLVAFSDLSFSSRELNITIWQTGLLLVLLMPLLLPKGFIPRKYALILLMPVVYGFSFKPLNESELKLNVFDVGQGLSVLLQTRNHQLLYDTGPAFRSGSSAAERVVGPWLKARNIRKISALVLSHSDNDHAGGAYFIREKFSPLDIYAPEKDSLNFTQACKANRSWEWDGVHFEFLYPFDDTRSTKTNNLSCVLRVRVAEQSVLLTGDIEKAAESSLLQSYTDLQTSLVFVPHHGSRTSSSSAFIHAVKPKVAIIPAGFANRWRFPKQDILANWQANTSRVLTVAQTGEIEVRIREAEALKIKTWSKEYCRYWHQDCE